MRFDDTQRSPMKMKFDPTGRMKLVCEFHVSEPEGAKFAQADQGPARDVAVVYLLSTPDKLFRGTESISCWRLAG